MQGCCLRVHDDLAPSLAEVAPGLATTSRAELAEAARALPADLRAGARPAAAVDALITMAARGAGDETGLRDLVLTRVVPALRDVARAGAELPCLDELAAKRGSRQLITQARRLRAALHDSQGL